MAHGPRMGKPRIKGRNKHERTEDRSRTVAVIPKPPELVVRPLEMTDSRKVVELVYKVVYVEGAKTLAIESIQTWDFLTANVISSIIVYLLSQSMWIANIWFFVWPFVGYMYITSNMGSVEYNKGEDTRPGGPDFFDYWTEEGRLLLVAELIDKVVGSVCMIHNSSTEATVVRVVVDSDVNHSDIRERMLRMLLIHCLDRGIERLNFVTSFATKYSHIPELYGRLGFDLEGTTWKGTLPFFKVKFHEYCYIFEREEDDAQKETRIVKRD